MVTRTAKCACGRLSAGCEGEPELVSLCHCLECQRRTGAPYGIAAFFDRSAVSPSGCSTVFERSSDAGYRVTHHFCSTCGSTVYWYPERMPDWIAVAVGAFADPAFPAPSRSVHLERRHHWLDGGGSGGL